MRDKALPRAQGTSSIDHRIKLHFQQVSSLDGGLSVLRGKREDVSQELIHIAINQKGYLKIGTPCQDLTGLLLNTGYVQTSGEVRNSTKQELNPDSFAYSVQFTFTSLSVSPSICFTAEGGVQVPRVLCVLFWFSH